MNYEGRSDLCAPIRKKREQEVRNMAGEAKPINPELAKLNRIKLTPDKGAAIAVRLIGSGGS